METAIIYNYEKGLEFIEYDQRILTGYIECLLEVKKYLKIYQPRNAYKKVVQHANEMTKVDILSSAAIIGQMLFTKIHDTMVADDTAKMYQYLSEYTDCLCHYKEVLDEIMNKVKYREDIDDDEGNE